MTRKVKWVGWVLLAVVVGIQFVQPARTNPVGDVSESIYSQPALPADVAGILRRSCTDCHSNDTRWPWYSYVAPVSWMVVDDVNAGRKRVNFSAWQKLQTKKAKEGLEDLCDIVSEKGMPLRSYVWMHRETELSDAERKRLCEWTRQEQTRLAESVPLVPAKP